MCPFYGHPQGCSPTTLDLLDRAMMEAWHEMVFKNAAAARTPQGPAPLEPQPTAAQSPSEALSRSLTIGADRRSWPRSSDISSVDLRPKEGPSRK
jgi:hypothetical protein